MDVDGIAGDRALCSRHQRGLEPRSVEVYLEISDQVYLSAGILYPDARIAFVLDPRSVETPASRASPWDSGAFCRKLCPDLPSVPDPKRREMFRRYDLPAPQYREYLVHYVASCYWSPMDYLRLDKPHAFRDPIGALDSGHPRARNFEVRIPGRVPLAENTLMAVFVLDADVHSEPISRWLRQLEASGVQVTVQSCPGGHASLEKGVRDWIMTHLRWHDPA